MIVRILNIIRIVSNQMHKSATMVGLFLMTLLIMLSTVAAIPISNVNLFSNAMASEKNSDKNDNTQKYESYYSTIMINTEQIMRISIIISNRIKHSHVIVTTMVMIMDIMIKKYLITIVMRI